MPETSVPPPPKNHGGGAFIGAVVLMLLAMGGLLYWKFRSKEEAPTPVATVAPSVTAPHFDEAPPPPPTVAPDAGKAPAPTKKHVVSSGGNASCAAVCKGDAPAGLRAALAGAVWPCAVSRRPPESRWEWARQGQWALWPAQSDSG